ncbi:MAG: hypothetical protein RI953_911 [Pseudomonadota bacterium]
MKHRFVWVVCLGLLTGCKYMTFLRKQSLTLDAPKEMELVVYKQVGKSTERVMSPVGLIRGGQTIELEPGDYLVANECSGYEFKQTKDRPTKIPVRRLTLTLHGESAGAGADEKPIEAGKSSASPEGQESPPGAAKTPSGESTAATTSTEATEATAEPKSEESAKVESAPVQEKGFVHTTCVDPLDQHRNQWNQRREFDILPGTTEMRIGGRLIKLENHGETSDPIKLDLYPVAINSSFPETQARFYLNPEEKEAKNEASVVALEANSPTWLLPGNYTLEVNGTRRKVTVEQGARTDISVGVLRVEMPENFPLEDRLKAGGQPVFVYLDFGALLNMDTDYVVFPGSYNVSIEGSEVQDLFQVEGGEKTIVKTFAARVDAPPCPENIKSCKSAPRVTIHREQKPYALMIVEPRLPFLLLEGSYEYGVEGMRGIKRSLQKKSGNLAGEPLARVRIKWDVRQAQGRYRTDLVRIESRGQNTFGRSLDLLFHKPDEVYVPAGNYDLTYFVGDPVLERSKSRLALHLEPGQTREVLVPIYVEKVNRTDDNQANTPLKSAGFQDSSAGKNSSTSKKETEAAEGAPVVLPRSLTPLRR